MSGQFIAKYDLWPFYDKAISAIELKGYEQVRSEMYAFIAGF